jgi:DNA-binding NarL/FixJ family response regulator
LLVDFSSEITVGFFALLHEAAPECRIVLWVRTVSDELIAQAREVGVTGVLKRTATNDEFIEELRRIVAGEDVLEDHRPANSTKIGLTKRESQIVGLLAQGLRNKEIANCLGLTEGTVKSYLVHLFHKVGARDRFELAVLGLKNSHCGQAYWDGQNSFVTEPEESRSRPFLRSLVLVEPARRAGYPEGRKKASGE